jgi:hypothetical protein
MADLLPTVKRFPTAVKTVNKVPYKYTAKLTKIDSEIINPYDYDPDSNNAIVYAKAIKVKLKKNKVYKIAFNGKNLGIPYIGIYTPGARAQIYSNYATKKKNKTIVFTIHASKTGYYNIVVSDALNKLNKSFSLSIGAAKKPGKISGSLVSSINGNKLSGSDVSLSVYTKSNGKWKDASSYSVKDKNTYGKYSIGGLYSGLYRLEFYYWDKKGAHSRFYKKGSPKGVIKISKATSIRVKAGKTTKGINIKLPIK